MGLRMGSSVKTLKLEVDLLLFTDIRRNFLVGCTYLGLLRINNLGSLVSTLLPKYTAEMKDIRNLIIAGLALLLALSISQSPTSGAGTSKSAKIVQYTVCLEDAATSYLLLDNAIRLCKQYQP